MFLEGLNEQEIFFLLNKELGLPLNQLSNLYMYFKAQANQTGYLLEEHLKTFSPAGFPEKIKKEVEGKCSYGMDLPVWFCNREVKQKKLFLLSMDPMRKATKRDTVDFNSPFSLHMNEKNNYNQAILDLSKKYDLFLTDVFKLFFRESHDHLKLSNQNKDFTELDVHFTLLREETRIFQPDVIICLGKPALISLYKIGNLHTQPRPLNGELFEYSFKADNRIIPVFAIPHASNMASKWAKEFLKNNSSPNPYSPKTYLTEAIQMILDRAIK